MIFQKFLGSLVVFVCDFKKLVRRKISDLPLNKKHAKTDVVVDALVPGFIETGCLLFKRAFSETKWAWPKKFFRGFAPGPPLPPRFRCSKPVTQIAESVPRV